MQLSELKRESYDVVSSVGAACQTTHQLQQNGLREYSGPLDWFVLNSTPNLTKILESRFEDFMRLANLEIVGEHDANHLVKDTKYDCDSVHDFPKDKTLQESYSGFRETLDRRVSRFIDNVQNAERVLYVRAQINHHEVSPLLSVLEQYNPNFVLLTVNYTAEQLIVELDWGFDKVCAVEMPHPPDRWEGCDKSWGEVLQGINILQRSR